MAFFERGDEANSLVKCLICLVNVKENGLTNHINSCSKANSSKFDKGELKLCPYDANHIVKSDKMDVHLEYCDGYQKRLLSEFQKNFDFSEDEYSESESGSANLDDERRDDDDSSKA